MKILKQKSFTHKIIIAIVFVILFNFISPQISYGASDSFGGVLFEPVQDLVLTVGDAVINLIQSIILGTDISLLKLEHKTSGWANTTVWVVGGAVVGTAIVIIAAIATGGLALPVIAEAGSTLAAIGNVATFVAAAATTGASGALVGGVSGYFISKTLSSMLPETIYLPLYGISPEEIFANEIGLFDVNFFSPNTYDTYETVAGDTVLQTSTAAKLQETISSWYYSIRNFAIVAMLSILLYLGIKIIISSNNSQERAKYKERIGDWIIGLCLIFFLHYIMAFAVTITELITQAVNSLTRSYIEIIGDSTDLEDYVWTTTTEEEVFDTSGEMFASLSEQGYIQEEDGTYYLLWPMNLMGKARYEACLIVDDSEEGDNTLARQFGYTMIFLALVCYTVLFIFRYIRRLLMLAFLTIIAPFVAMTYPIDKVKDNSAQGFNTWLKEYVYNLLIQPVHLVLYTIFIGSALDFAMDNLVYSLVALGFILQAEKIMRNLFGFDHAKTVAGGSALGGALAMQGLNMIGKAVGGVKNKIPGKAGEKENNKIRTKTQNQGSIEERAGKPLGELAENINSKNNKDNSINNTANTARTTNNANNTTGGDRDATKWGRNDDGTARTEEEYNEQRAAAEQAALLAYNNDGYSQDTNGYYFNPWKDDYDAEYNPIEDPTYNRWEEQEEAKRIRFAEENAGTIGQDGNINIGINGQNNAETPNAESLEGSTNELNSRTSVDETNNYTDNKEAGINANTEQNAEEESKPKRALKVAKGIASVGGEAVKYAAPKAARLAVTGTLAAGGAMVGAAAGLVSEDYSNVATWGAGGATAGVAIGQGGMGATKGIINKGSELIQSGIETATSTYTQSVYGAAAEAERQQKRADEAAKRDQTRRSLYEKELRLKDKASVDKVMKQAQKYRDYGVTDDSIIIRTMRSSAPGLGGTAWDSDERILTAGLAAQVGKDSKKLDTARKDLKTKIKDDKEVDKYIEAIREVSGQKMV